MTSTRFVDFSRLEHQGASAVTISQLMIAGNDLGFAREALVHNSPAQTDRQAAARRYFLRIQIGHLCEALKSIACIDGDPFLRGVLAASDPVTRQNYETLRLLTVRDSKENTEFRRIATAIRDKTTFHYDEAPIKAAIKSRATRAGSRTSSITRGDDCRQWFKAGDDIVDTVVCRKLWNADLKADLREEAGKYETELHTITVTFVDFVGALVWKYFSY